MASSIAATPAASTALAVIIVSQLLGTSLWFTANAAAPGLMADWNLSIEDVGLLTVAVQLGFIAGTLFLALTSLTDRYRASAIFAASAGLGAVSNLAFSWLADGLAAGIVLRFATGAFLAGIYPVGMKLVVGWAPRHANLYLGWLVGMLTFGTALPHLIRALTPGWPWQEVVAAGSLLALVAAAAVLRVGDGPGKLPAQSGRPPLGAAFAAFRNREFRAAAAGYFGHMWELYAFWTLVPFLLVAVLAGTPWDEPAYISALSFGVIAIGGIGCIAGGRLASHIGSRMVAATSLGISGLMCALFPLHDWPVALALAGLFVWGIAVVPDSPQFSAIAATAAPPRLLGSALALQNSIGFLVSSISIWLTTWAVDIVGVHVTWLLLPGPLLGLAVAARLWRGVGRSP